MSDKFKSYEQFIAQRRHAKTCRAQNSKADHNKPQKSKIKKAHMSKIKL
jgi:hypothetical protein